MTSDFPNDSDEDALCRVAECSSDMSKPMCIDFHVAVPDEAAAKALGDVAGELGYRVCIYDSAECRLPWTCQCSTRMLATYEGVIAIQEELARISAPFGGIPDGRGTLGNDPSGRHPVT